MCLAPHTERLPIAQWHVKSGVKWAMPTPKPSFLRSFDVWRYNGNLTGHHRDTSPFSRACLNHESLIRANVASCGVNQKNQERSREMRYCTIPFAGTVILEGDSGFEKENVYVPSVINCHGGRLARSLVTSWHHIATIEDFVNLFSNSTGCMRVPCSVVGLTACDKISSQ